MEGLIACQCRPAATIVCVNPYPWGSKGGCRRHASSPAKERTNPRPAPDVRAAWATMPVGNRSITPLGSRWPATQELIRVI